MKYTIKQKMYAVIGFCTLFGTFTFAQDAYAIAVDTQAVTNIGGTGAMGHVIVTEEIPDGVTILWGQDSGSYNEGTCYAYLVSGDEYECEIFPLSPDTTYYVQAYAYVDGGNDAVGDEVTFTTGPSPIVTQSISDITATTATGHMTVEGEHFSRVGLAWGTTSGSYWEGNCEAATDVGAGDYSCDLTWLTEGTTYYVRAYGIAGGGEIQRAAYGNEITFTPADVSIEPFIDMISGVTDTSATVTAAIGLNGASCTGNDDPAWCTYNYERVIEWYSESFLEFGECDAGNGLIGDYSCEITGLTPGTTYYVSARVGAPTGEGGGINYYYSGGEPSFFTTNTTSGGGGVGGSVTQGISNDITTDVQDVLSLSCNQTGSANDFIVELGDLTPGTPVIGSTTCSVTTNSDAGYALAVKRNDANSTMDKDGDIATDIGDRTEWSAVGNGNATAWAVNDVDLAFTVYGSTATKNETWWGAGVTAADANNKYAGFPVTYQNIMQHVNYSEVATTTNIGYKIDVSTTQKSGTYSGDITYQVTTAP